MLYFKIFYKLGTLILILWILTDTLTKPNKLNSAVNSNANLNLELSDENTYDSDKDPEYIQPLLLKGLNS